MSDLEKTLAQPTMSSIELLALINQARAAFNEPEVRRNQFNARVEDELEGTHYKKTVVTNENGTESIVFELSQDQCMLVSMRESKAVRRWVLEKIKTMGVPQTYAQALLEAGRLAQLAEEQAQQLALAAPKVEFVDRFVQASTGSKTFRQVAKLLKANERHFRAFLEEKGVMYRLGGEWMPYAKHIEADRFEVKAGVAENDHAYTAARFTAKGVEWVAGEWAKHQVALVTAQEEATC